MSPIGGVGINLAVQDAVAATTLLAPALQAGTLTPADLAAVRRRRIVPTVLVQGMQRMMHRVIVEPVLSGSRAGAPKPMIALMRRFPALTVVPATLIGPGFRSEHAPAFAVRSPDHVR